MTNALGFDVSVAQGRIDWTLLGDHAGYPGGRVFVIAKATEADAYVDPQFAANAKGAREAKLRFGAYEFAHLDRDPEKCADHTCDVILENGFSDEDLPPSLDVERLRGTPHGQDVVTWILRWAKRCESRVERRPIIYTGAGYWSAPAVGNPDSLELGTYELWLAAYVLTPDRYVPLPWRARGWTLWQKSGDVAAPGKPILHLPGIGGGKVAVDDDEIAGTVEALIARSFVHRRPTLPLVEAGLMLGDGDRGPANPLGLADRAESRLRDRDAIIPRPSPIDVVTQPGTPAAITKKTSESQRLAQMRLEEDPDEAPPSTEKPSAS